MRRAKFSRRKPSLQLPPYVYDAYRRVRTSLDSLNRVFLDGSEPDEIRFPLATSRALEFQNQVINFVSALLVEAPDPNLPPSTTIKE